MNEQVPSGTAEPTTSTGALWSLILGILGLVCLGPFGAVPAVIFGHISHSRIARSGGALQGQGLALGGMITGYIGIAMMIFVLPMLAAIAIPSFVKARSTAQQNACMNNLRQIDAAKEQWALAGKKTNGSEIALSEVNEYIKGSATPICPTGGSYTYSNIGTDPQCSTHGGL
jgi:hypothetical protein